MKCNFQFFNTLKIFQYVTSASLLAHGSGCCSVEAVLVYTCLTVHLIHSKSAQYQPVSNSISAAISYSSILLTQLRTFSLYLALEVGVNNGQENPQLLCVSSNGLSEVFEQTFSIKYYVNFLRFYFML